MDNSKTQQLFDGLLCRGMSEGSLSLGDMLSLCNTDGGKELFNELIEIMVKDHIEMLPIGWEIKDKASVRAAAEKIRTSCEEEKSASSSGVRDALVQYLNELSSAVPLSIDEDRELSMELLQQLSEENEEGLELLRMKLFEGSMYLPAAIAMRHLGEGMLFLDMAQEGSLILTELSMSFGNSGESCFAAAASFAIEEHLMELTGSGPEIVEVPQEMAEDLARIRNEISRSRADTGITPDCRRLSETLGLTEERIRNIINAVSGGNETVEASEDDAEHEKSPADKMLAQRVQSLLSALPEREAEVLKLRYGIGSPGPMETDEIAKKLKISAEEAAEIEAKALRHLGA